MLSLCPDPNPPRIDETEGCTRDGAVRGRLVKLMLVQQASYESPYVTDAALEQDAKCLQLRSGCLASSLMRSLSLLRLFVAAKKGSRSGIEVSGS